MSTTHHAAALLVAGAVMPAADAIGVPVKRGALSGLWAPYAGADQLSG